MILKCPCSAEYDSNSRWMRGRFNGPTSSMFIPYSFVQPGACPICGKPPIRIEEDKPKYKIRGTM